MLTWTLILTLTASSGTNTSIHIPYIKRSADCQAMGTAWVKEEEEHDDRIPHYECLLKGKDVNGSL